MTGRRYVCDIGVKGESIQSDLDLPCSVFVHDLHFELSERNDEPVFYFIDTPTKGM